MRHVHVFRLSNKDMQITWGTMLMLHLTAWPRLFLICRLQGRPRGSRVPRWAFLYFWREKFKKTNGKVIFDEIQKLKYDLVIIITDRNVLIKIPCYTNIWTITKQKVYEHDFETQLCRTPFNACGNGKVLCVALLIHKSERDLKINVLVE